MDKARSKLMKDSFEESKRENHVSKGGGSDYKMQRSSIVKDPKTGYGMPMSMARAKMIEKLGYNPGKGIVASHLQGGRHKEKDGGAFRMESLAQNTARSNIMRQKDKEEIKRDIKRFKLPK